MSVQLEIERVCRIQEVCVEEPFNVDRIREDFPLLERTMRARPLIYLDSAATSQKPRAVLDAVTRFYQEDNANVHRGAYALGDRATWRYEEARARAQRYLNAAHPLPKAPWFEPIAWSARPSATSRAAASQAQAQSGRSSSTYAPWRIGSCPR